MTNKAKHFEDLWEEAEQIAEEYFSSENDIWSNLIDYHSNFEFQDLNKYDIGEILFNLAALSARQNINVFESLQTTIKERKEMILAREDDFEPEKPTEKKAEFRLPPTDVIYEIAMRDSKRIKENIEQGIEDPYDYDC